MTVPKLKEQALEKLQQEAEKVVKERICFHRNMVLTLADHYRSERSLSEIIKKHVDKLSEENKQGFWQNLKLTLREIITDEGFITRFKEYSSTLENYFEGSQTGASPNAQQALSNFRYYNELTINALEFFNQNDVNQFHNRLIDKLRYENKIYALPFYATSPVTIYNKEIYNKCVGDNFIKSYDDKVNF
jgi:hypothetical protein